MSNYLKYFKSEFEKYGRYKSNSAAPGASSTPATGSPATPAASSTTPTAPVSGGRYKPHDASRDQPAMRGAGSSKEIRAMQDAMQRLAKTVSSSINYDQLKKGLAQKDPADKKQFESAYGQDAFSNFIVNRYLRNSKVKGVEYSIDPTQTKMEDKSKDTSDLNYMFIVLDTLNRIGNPKAGENNSDGVWGPRTNNALQNTAAIADSVMKLGKELGMQSSAFDANKIGELPALIPATDKEISLEEKLKRAPVITQILNGVNALFLDFKEQVQNDPTYKNIIIGRQPIFSHGPAKKGIDMSEGERAIHNDLLLKNIQSQYVRGSDATFQISVPENYAKMIPGLKSSTLNINAAHLLSQEIFQNAVTAADPALKNYQQSNPGTFKNLLKEILAQVNAQVEQKSKGPAVAAPLQTTR